MRCCLTFFLLLSLSPSILSLSALPSMTTIACTDHSDCTVLGHKYGCLLYLCTDYTDPMLASCAQQNDCDSDQYTCVRTDLPPYPEGFCLLSSSLQQCSSQAMCGAGHGCCGGWCCPQQYFSQWQNFSCFSHQQCRSWSTGQYCCPDNKCCMSLPDYQEYYSYDYNTHQYYDQGATYYYTDTHQDTDYVANIGDTNNKVDESS